MDFLEKNLEDIIYETDCLDLNERGIYISDNKKRQVKIGNYGIADIVSWDKEYGQLQITVYELKQKNIDANALMQAYRYKRGIESYIKKRKPKLRFLVNIVLIGKTLCKGDFCYALGSNDELSVYTYEYKFDGIKFSSHYGYLLREEGFGG